MFKRLFGKKPEIAPNPPTGENPLPMIMKKLLLLLVIESVMSAFPVLADTTMSTVLKDRGPLWNCQTIFNKDDSSVGDVVNTCYAAMRYYQDKAHGANTQDDVCNNELYFLLSANFVQDTYQGLKRQGKSIPAGSTDPNLLARMISGIEDQCPDEPNIRRIVRNVHLTWIRRRWMK